MAAGVRLGQVALISERREKGFAVVRQDQRIVDPTKAWFSG